MANDIKFCKDCVNFDSDYAACTLCKSMVEYNLVTGVSYFTDGWEYSLAKHERKSILPWHCGKKARYFEEKE